MYDTESCPFLTFDENDDEPKKKVKFQAPEQPEPTTEPEQEEVEEEEVEEEDEPLYNEEEVLATGKEIGVAAFKLGWVYGVRDYALTSGVISMVLAASIQIGLSIARNLF